MCKILKGYECTCKISHNFGGLDLGYHTYSSFIVMNMDFLKCQHVHAKLKYRHLYGENLRI